MEDTSKNASENAVEVFKCKIQIVEKKVEIILEAENEINSREKIVVVDEISNPSDFSKSANILKEIKRYSDIKIDFAYPLVKGGIAIHTQSKEQRDLLIEQLPIDSFQGGKKCTLSKVRPKPVFVKNVDTKVNAKEIEIQLKSRGIDVSECKRIVNQNSQKPTRTIKVTVKSEEDQIKLISNFDFKVGTSICNIEKQKYSKVIRCYVCQQFGHVSINCKSEKRCVRCADNHNNNSICTLPEKCANCSEEHKASDNRCPIYIKYNEIASKQYSKY